MKTTREIQQEKIKEELEPLQRIEKQEEERKNETAAGNVNVPSAQPEVKEIEYAECANAMLKMWIDNVLTDGEYNRVMDRLNAHQDTERRRAESEEKE